MSKIWPGFNLAFQSWPIRPMPTVIVLTIFQILVNFAVLAAAARAQGTTVKLIQLLVTGPSVLLGFIFGLVVLSIFKRLTEKFPQQRTALYWLGGAFFGAAMSMARILSISDLTPEYWKDPATAVRVFIGAAMLFLTVQVSLGVSNARLAEQVAVAEAAKASLEVQRGKLISAQEDVRRQIADFLHDRLQSDLVLLGIQMQRFIEKLSDKDRSVAQAYIEEIERIRQFDVRSVSKQLAPELTGPFLRPALEDLLSSYLNVIEVQLKLSEHGYLTPQLKLACYRIVEQGLLNAAKHAAADQVSITVIENPNQLEILVKNNGVLLQPNPVAGAGFAIIEDWVGQFDGTWSLSSAENQTVLAVTLRF